MRVKKEKTADVVTLPSSFRHELGNVWFRGSRFHPLLHSSQARFDFLVLTSNIKLFFSSLHIKESLFNLIIFAKPGYDFKINKI